MLLTGQSISGFDPKSIPGIQLWLDAVDTSTMTFSSGSNISQWNDKSGNALHFSNSTTSQQPTFVSTTPAYVNIQSNANAGLYNSSSGLFNTAAWDMYCVIRLSTTGGQIGILSEYPGTNYIWCTTGSSTVYSLYVNGSWVLSPNTAPSSDSVFQLYQLYSTGTQVGRRINAVFGGSGTDQYAGYSYPTRSGTRRIGLLNNSVAGQWQSGAGLLISEIIVYDTALTDIQRSQVEGYLTWKWGLQSSLVSTHSFRSMKPHTRPFQPIDIDGCALWLDAADTSSLGFSSGSNVNLWKDKSGNGYSVIQPTTAYQPTYSANLLNGLPGVKLSLAGFLYQFGSNMPNFAGATSTTLIIVAKNGTSYPPSGWNTISTMWFNETSTTRYHFTFGLNAAQGVTLYISGAPVGQTTVVPLGSNAIVGFTASAGGNEINVNGTISSYTGTVPTNAANSTWFQLGDSRNSYTSDVNIYEVIGYSPALTSAQRQRVEGYLAWKWGLYTQLPSTHPRRSTPAASVLPFNPVGVPTLALWLDGGDSSSMTFSGSNVTGWNDKSGNGKNMTSGGTITYNQSQRRLELDGQTNSFFTGSIASTPIANPSYVIVSRQSSGSGPLFTRQNNEYGYFPSYGGGLYLQNADAGWSAYSSPVANGTDYIHSVVYDPSNVSLWVSGSNISNASRTAFTTSAIDIGARRSNWSERMTGFIYEFIVFNATLTTSQRQVVEGHLAWKWGLQNSLPSTHPYYKFVPSFQIYPAPLAPPPPVSSYTNFLWTRFYNIVSDPSINGPGSSGWGALIGTAGAYNPINFQDGDGRIGQSDFVGVISKGFMYSATTTVVTFRTNSDDGIALYFNGNLVLQNWTYHGDTINDSASVTLPAGYTPIELRFFEWGGGFTCELSWSIGSTGSYASDGTGVMFYDTTSQS